MDLSISLLNILFSVISTTSKQINSLNHYDVEVLSKILHAFFYKKPRPSSKSFLTSGHRLVLNVSENFLDLAN